MLFSYMLDHRCETNPKDILSCPSQKQSVLYFTVIKKKTSIQSSHTSWIQCLLEFFNVMKLYCKTDWQCCFVPEGSCHFQTYRSNVEALSHAVSAEGLLPLAWQSLLVALGIIAISATFVPSVTAIAMWPNDNIKSQCTGTAWVGKLKRTGCWAEIVIIRIQLMPCKCMRVMRKCGSQKVKTFIKSKINIQFTSGFTPSTNHHEQHQKHTSNIHGA